MLLVLAGGVRPVDAVGARLFAYSGQMAMVCEVDPTTGVELSSFSVPKGDNPGLAFNGVELFFTNDA
jgi:hypothetical protein